MPRDNKTNKGIQFLKENWLFLVGIIVVFPYLRAFMQKMAVKTQVDDVKNDMDLNAQINALDNPVLQESEADKILRNFPKSQKERFKADVKQFVHHLGINYPSYDPRSWTENDKEAVEILMRWVKLLPKFQELYYQVYTKSRNLKTDFYKLIDQDEKTRMYAHQIAHNVKYF